MAGCTTQFRDRAANAELPGSARSPDNSVMLVALYTTFTASKKEPLALLLERIHTAFLTADLGEPATRFSFSDAPVPGFTSSVDRVLKKYPELQRFFSDGPVMAGIPPVRRLSNGPASAAPDEAVEFSTLLAIAGGVPRSFPFHNLSIHFQAPAFGAALSVVPTIGPSLPGVTVGDSWWVNGRMRSLTALASVDADPGNKKMPPLPDRVAAVLAACGKAKSTVQIPLGASVAPTTPSETAPPSLETARSVHAVVLDYRSRLEEVIDRAALPHDLPPAMEALKTIGLAATTGPKKPVLVRAFKPMGYDCRAGSGTFTLRRRTAGNLTVEIALDVGTWSRSLTSGFSVTGLGFTARLPLPVSKRAMGGGQYKIGDAEHWQKLVENLAALVAEFDRSFVPLVAAASGPSPEWYKPES